jgi:hypothetical protein
MTSLRQVGPAVEVRIFNPNPVAVAAALQWDSQLSFRHVIPVDFDSQPVADSHPLTTNQFTVTLAQKKILTLRFE